jgi:hypothetical protein
VPVPLQKHPIVGAHDLPDGRLLVPDGMDQPTVQLFLVVLSDEHHSACGSLLLLIRAGGVRAWGEEEEEEEEGEEDSGAVPVLAFWMVRQA